MGADQWLNGLADLEPVLGSFLAATYQDPASTMLAWSMLPSYTTVRLLQQRFIALGSTALSLHKPDTNQGKCCRLVWLAFCDLKCWCKETAL